MAESINPEMCVIRDQVPDCCQAGICFFCLKELRTTATELPAIAAAARRGLTQPIIARGMVRVL